MVTLKIDWPKVAGRTACSIGTAVTGDTGGVNVYEAVATSLLLLAWKPATVTVHLVQCPCQ